MILSKYEKKDIPDCKWEIMICVFNIYMKERIEKPKLFKKNYREKFRLVGQG
jgi:hypothetical protein